MQDSTKIGIEKFGRALVYFVYFFLVVTLVILTFAFFLQLFGANPDASFTEWVYRAAKRVMAPFRGIFEPVDLNGQSTLNTSILFAMIVYGIVAIAVRALIDWLTYRITLIAHQSVAGAAPPATSPPPESPPPANR